MKSVLRGNLTYANVISTLCLFLLLGGGAAFAATKLAKNSVGTKQLKKNAITTAKIKNEALTAAKVKKGTLTGTQIDASTLGKVPLAMRSDSAANADAVGGVALAGLLRSDRVLIGTAPAEPAGKPLLHDARTGLEVLTGTSGALRLLNTNTQDAITGTGIGYYGGLEPHSTEITLAPGEQFDLRYEAASFTYGQYVFMGQASGVPLQLSCSEREIASHLVLSCVAVG